MQGGLTVALDSRIPEGPLEEKWDNHKFDIKLVNPANKRRFDIIVVGTGLAGASAAASLAEDLARSRASTSRSRPTATLGGTSMR